MKKKSLMKMMVCACLLMLCSITAFAQENALSGEWTFKAPDAPYGYEAGTVKFKKDANGKLCADLQINDATITIERIEKKGDKYVCSPINLEGSEVNISFIPKDGKLKATAQVDYTVIYSDLTPKGK